ncbi:6-phosphogluconolactonase [Candidatus Saccharibacteria bacterium]|nr:MAG: 6-phosphogluconolactonase [Candidatus Saccharibacteria bacterium]
MKYSTEGIDLAKAEIATVLAGELKSGKRLLWLVSGGSCVAVQVDVMKRLREAAPDKLSLLTILPVDERFGRHGHENSNSAQMQKAGFKPEKAKWLDVLNKNQPMAETVSYYAQLAEDAMAEADVVVATLGMGADAHTAGLLPESPALTDTVSTVVGYSWSDFARMTLGVPMLLKINHAWVLAYGETKKESLKRLQRNAESVEHLPAKILYDLASVTVYNDYIQT